jgi:mercuric ion transport protein
VKDRTLLRTGIVGSVVAALCCGTPVLAVLLGALGLSAWLAWADYVILPALIVFPALAFYALHREWNRERRRG